MKHSAMHFPGLRALILELALRLGWLASLAGFAPAFGQASGGTVSTSGAYTVHTFTSSGTFTVNAALSADVVIVGGGGGGGHQHAGGGGAGGVQLLNGYAVATGSYAITVGNGGTGCTWYPYTGTNGGNSSAFGYNALGGGAGTGMDQYGNDGGSGGAEGYPTGGIRGGNGTTGQGNLGSRGGSISILNGGGGGGAGGAGWGLAGGAALSTWAGTFAGGGGGGYGGGAGGGAGAGNGGNGAGFGGHAVANTGSGGGGGGNMDAYGGNGGSGVVVIRYLTQATTYSQTVTIRAVASKTVAQTVALSGGGLDQPYYRATYSDLNNAFGTNVNLYWDHFQDYGYLEGRSPYAGSGNEAASFARSGLPVTFSVISGPGVIVGNTLSFNGGGTVVLRATQAGGATTNGRNYNSAYAETSITVVNRNPTNTTQILNNAKTVLATNPTASVNVAFGDSFYIRVSGTDPDGRLAMLFSRIDKVGGASGWDYPAVGASGASASYDFGPYNTANGGGIGLADVWSHVKDADSVPYDWQGNGWWGEHTPNVNIVKATPTGAFAATNLSAGIGQNALVKEGNLSATFANPYSGLVTAPTGQATYAIAPGSLTGTPGTPLNPGTLLPGGTYVIRATYPGDANYNSAYVDATWTVTVLTDSDGDSTPNIVETQLGTNPSAAATKEQSTFPQTQLKVHRPQP